MSQVTGKVHEAMKKDRSEHRLSATDQGLLRKAMRSESHHDRQERCSQHVGKVVRCHEIQRGWREIEGGCTFLRAFSVFTSLRYLGAFVRFVKFPARMLGEVSDYLGFVLAELELALVH